MNAALRGLAANPSLPSGLLDRLIATARAGAGADAEDDTGDDLAGALAHRPGLGRAHVVALLPIGEAVAVALVHAGHLTAADIDPVARPEAALAFLDRGAGPPEWARRLAADPDPWRRERLAACPGLPPDVVAALAADPEVEVVAELAQWTSAAVTARLAAHPHARVRQAVACNLRTPPEVLVALLTGAGLPPVRLCADCACGTGPPAPAHRRSGACEDGSHASVPDIVMMALRNPGTPAGSAAAFAGHPSPALRREVAERPDLPPGVYLRLADDPAPWTRSALAANPAIGGPVIRRLAVERDADVRRTLARHPRLPLDVLAGLARAARIGADLLPRVAAASVAEVARLAASPRPEVRVLVARRRDLPDPVRDALAADPDAKVVGAVASHPGIGEARMHALLDRHGRQVAAALATNPDASPAVLERLAALDPPVRGALAGIARHPNATAAALTACLADRKTRCGAAAHPALPPPVVVALLGADEPDVREAAAANPALPVAAMEALLPGGHHPA
ncbi:hypothetical protein KNE206_39600 [Kitasatospora sp. NE20-6]|uniref:hypothetical protein n=1 Tax=Kitasatospora sp. NE20-6 TaxID=2859066 RepID=UPI0034DC68A1